MFGIGSTELLLIFVVGLIILGPKNLANMAKSLGKAMGEFRRVSTDFQRTINSEIDLDDHQERKKEAEKELFPDDKKEEPAAKTENANPEILSSAEKAQNSKTESSTSKTNEEEGKA